MCLHCKLDPNLNIWNAQKFEQLLALGIVLWRDLDSTSVEFIDSLLVANFLRLFLASVCLFAFLCALGKLVIHVLVRSQRLEKKTLPKTKNREQIRHTSPDLSVGGFPSKTYTGLIPLSTIRRVR